MATIDPKAELQAAIDQNAVDRPTTFRHRGTDFTVDLKYLGVTTDPNDLWYRSGGPTQADASPFQVYKEAFELLISKAKNRIYDLAVQRKKREYDKFIVEHVNMADLDPRSFDEVRIPMKMDSHSKALATGYIPDPYLPRPLHGHAYANDNQYFISDSAMRESRLNRPGVVKHRFQVSGRFVYATPGDTEDLVMQLPSLDLLRDYIVLESVDKFDTSVEDDIVADVVHNIEADMFANAVAMIEAREKEGMRQETQEDR